MARVEQWEHITFAPVGFPVFEYAVKCICGRTDGGAVAPGVCYTAINFHNPTNTTISFWKKFAVAWPSEQAGPRTGFISISTELRPDHALETDCPDIVGTCATPTSTATSTKEPPPATESAQLA